jgi:hypothetical protein
MYWSILVVRTAKAMEPAIWEALRTSQEKTEPAGKG